MEHTDPIIERRERIRSIAGAAQRVGYLLFAVATVAFFVGLITSFSGAVTTVVIIALILGSIVLAIAIQVAYAIRGAERHEEESSAQRRRR